MEKVKHKVLALKYRPKNFKELIGQNIMVETITNSIKLNKLPNAYLLTGIRGVGKTTTARLIAKALNCNKDFLKEENCDCSHCEEIANSKHLDVVELDAASRTGISDVRTLIESSKYNPTSAKYKIIILDEVHMLSNQAFNGLLKTLEEPPPHLKFIFATTELKKVPVKVLLDNLKKILSIEKGKISEDALLLIAKSAEGSVRDSLSLLDRALIGQTSLGKEIDETYVRKMLGIADRTKVLSLLEFVFEGDQKKSIDLLREMINEGIEPKIFLNDLLEIIYFIQQKKILGNLESELSISESEQEIINSISKKIDMNTLIIFWQFILKGIDELSVVFNPTLSLEMIIIRLLYLKDMPSYESLLDYLKKDYTGESGKNDNNEIRINNEKKIIKDENQTVKNPKDQIKNISQTKLNLSPLKKENFSKDKTKERILSFEDLIYLTSKKREIQLKYDLENNVNLIKFSEGKIDISFNQNLDKNFVRNLSSKLVQWTGRRWVITLSKEMGSKTFSENQTMKKEEQLNNEKKGDIYKNFKNIFSDAELLEVKKDK